MLAKIHTYYRLGVLNLARVAAYRLAIKSGLMARCLPGEKPIAGPFFDFAATAGTCPSTNSPWMSGFSDGFSCIREKIDDPPDWHRSLMTGVRHPGASLHWTRISDFAPEIGDIKGVWELSRFDWLIAFCRQYLHDGDRLWLDKMNDWLEDWSRHNPGNVGPNWKCGQEVSIRVMRLALVGLLSPTSNKITSGLSSMLESHLRRIEPTIHYAIGQDNNHGTSEAAALFIGGGWLERNGGSSDATRWARKGRCWLENRLARLVESDGTFSQYSVNYHRFMLDTISLSELWRRKLELLEFSDKFYEKASLATRWLWTMTDPATGEVPNLGANDGARMLILDDSDYRDFRPSVQLAAALFLNGQAFSKPGPYDLAPRLLGVAAEKTLTPIGSQVFDQGGFTVLTLGGAKVFFRYPRFRFRPAQSDLLHLDFWLDGRNILRDAGTYSYNTETEWMNYFSGTAAHNTIQFDDRDQMPRLSRFLFGGWPEAKCDGRLHQDADTCQFAAGYSDWLGAGHRRELAFTKHELKVIDRISGFGRKAVLRWRLMPADWSLTADGVCGEGVTIAVRSDHTPQRLEIVEGFESRNYSIKTALPVLEVEFDRETTITTIIKWDAKRQEI